MTQKLYMALSPNTIYKNTAQAIAPIRTIGGLRGNSAAPTTT